MLDNILQIIKPAISDSLKEVGSYEWRFLDEDSKPGKDKQRIYTLVVQLNFHVPPNYRKNYKFKFGNLFATTNVHTIQWMAVSFSQIACKESAIIAQFDTKNERIVNYLKGDLCFTSDHHMRHGRPYLAFTDMGIVPVVFVHQKSIRDLMLPNTKHLYFQWVKRAVDHKFTPRGDNISLVTIETIPTPERKRKMEDNLMKKTIDDNLYKSFKRWKGPPPAML